MSDVPSMPHRMLGRTGLQVSVLSYGFWATFGAKEGLGDEAGIQRAMDCLRVARKGGVNLFDNAEVYGSPRGEAERIMGEAIARLQVEDPDLWRRSDILITTKIFWGGDGVNEKGLSRKHIMEGLDAALDRLQVDYVDLVFCHRPDPYTPTETVVRAMTDAVRGGLASAWGTSEWSAQQITEAVWIARTMGLEPPQFEQPQYNMFHRDRFEQEYHPLYRAPYQLGTTIWSPLMSGILTGKYNDAIPEGSRLTQSGYEWLQQVLQQHRDSGVIDKVRALTSFAQDSWDAGRAGARVVREEPQRQHRAAGRHEDQPAGEEPPGGRRRRPPPTPTWPDRGDPRQQARDVRRLWRRRDEAIPDI